MFVADMQGVHSEPSLGTSTGKKNTTSQGSHITAMTRALQCGSHLWEGRMRKITECLLMLVWKNWWNILVIATIIFKYVLNFLLILRMSCSCNQIIYPFQMLCEAIFFIDVVIHILHNYWPIVRLHIRIFRRSLYTLLYDIISLVPIILTCQFINKFYYTGITCQMIIFFGRCLVIGRIYRVVMYFRDLNGEMQKSRRLLFLLEHTLLVVLVLHASTCLWNILNQPEAPEKPWYDLGFPTSVRRARLTFQSYLECWYYSAGRFFNVIFGDSFPCNSLEKWLTSFLMLFGFVLMRYQFVGIVAWDMIVHLERWSQFVDRYHHMTKYLKACGAPPSLIEQAKNYKVQLWKMKKGVLTSNHLQQLPHPLQMELIFDINVGHFHRSMLLRDTGEPFMRQLALVMRHELYLAGQQIWNQGVVKSGLIVIKQGVVELLSDEDDESPIIAFKEGTVLGELSLFHSIPAKVSVRAATYVELQVLHRRDFMRVVLENPLVLHDVRNKMEKRVKNTRARQERIAEYDSNDSRLIRTRYRPMKVFQDHLAGVKDEDPTFVDDSHLYYRDKNNQRLPKFTNEYLELYKLCSNVTTVDSPRIILNSNFPWILEADTDLIHTFDLVHFFMVLYVCITSPLRAIGFSISETQKVIDIIIMAGLLFNIYRQLTTCIVKKNVRKVTVKEIAEEKMSSIGFYMDIISVFPMYIFIETLFPDRDSMWVEVSELFPVLQIWHLWDYCSKWQRSFGSNTKLLIVLRFAIMQCMFCYWSGVFLYMYSCPKRQCHKNSWMAQLILLETKVFVTNHAQHEYPITTSLGFGTAIFTGSGIGELAPGTYDLWVVVLLFIVGAYMQIFYIARICATCLLSTKRKLMFTESMRELFYFLTVNRVSAKIKARVKKFFGVQWYYNQAVSVDEIFKDMSVNIQQEVLSIEMMETLLHCPLFQDCSRDFLQTVAGCVTTVVLPEDEIVQHAADINRDMYILQKGHCNVLNNSGKVVGSVAPGSHFGVVEMMFCLPKVHTVITTTNCVLRHMEYSSLLQCWSTFPEINQPILVVLQDPELIEMAAEYEDAKPLTGRIEVKVNRFAREIKDSFVMLRSPEDKRDYHREFDKLGILRHIRYVFLPISITPYGIFLKCWSGLRFLVALYYMFIIPYNIAIQRHRFNSKYMYLDIFLYFDLIVMSYVGYYDDKRLLVKHPLFTVSRYIKTTFFWDVIAIFPFEQLAGAKLMLKDNSFRTALKTVSELKYWVTESPKDDMDKERECKALAVRNNMLMRRFARCTVDVKFRIVNESVDLDLFRLNRICLVTRLTGAFTYWESNIMNINPAVVMFKFLPLAMTFVNFMTAFIFMNSCKSFMRLVNHTNTTPTQYIYVNCSKTLIMSASEKSVQAVALNEYVYTGFWVVILFMGCGCAPILLTGESDAMMVMLVQIVGLLYFAFMVGYMISLRSASAHALLEHTENTRDLTNFLYQENVDPMLTAKTLKYFEYVWKRTNGSNPQQICRCLNSALMEDTLVFMYEHALREVPLFGKVERSFIRVITQHLNEMYFLKGETVVQYRDVQTNIYIIYRGKVDVLSPVNEMITCMGPGGMFGNFTGQPISCSDVSIYASRSLDLLVIPCQTFFNLVKVYPRIQDLLKKALQNSTDYILPISMDNIEDNSSGESDLEEDEDSEHDSINGFEEQMEPHVQLQRSFTDMSMAKSHSSIGTYQSYMHVHNLIRPGSWLYQGFGYLCCLMATINYVLVSYQIVTLNDCKIFFWMQGALDIFFYVKIYLNMHQAFVNKRGVIVVDPSKCRRQYRKRKWWMWSDILANTPFELLGFAFPNVPRAMHYLRCTKLLRLKYLVEFYKKTSAELTNNLTILQAMTTLFVVILLVHTLTCVWLLVLMANSPICFLRRVKMYLFDNKDLPHHRWDYTTSFYVMVSELTGTGGDEFVIEEIKAFVLLSLSVVCGKMLAAMIVATCIQLSYSAKSALTNYERKVEELVDVLSNQGLSNYQLKKYWMYIKQLWVYERGRQLPVLLAQTPHVRRCDLMSAMFGHHLQNCFLFADTGEHFLRQLTAVLTYTTFFPGNYIVAAGDSEACMYWVTQGTVSVLSVRTDLTEITHEFLGPGDVFGILQGLTRGIMHCFSYRAETKVGILTLCLDSWINILPYFPQAQNIINARSELLYAQF